MKLELEQYPKIRANYIRAFGKMIARRKELGKPTTWETGEEVMEWWMKKTFKEKEEEGQCSIFGE